MPSSFYNDLIHVVVVTGDECPNPKRIKVSLLKSVPDSAEEYQKTIDRGVILLKELISGETARVQVTCDLRQVNRVYFSTPIYVAWFVKDLLRLRPLIEKSISQIDLIVYNKIAFEICKQMLAWQPSDLKVKIAMIPPPPSSSSSQFV